MIFLAGLTILKKERCLGRFSGREVDPVVALHLRNAADYRLSYFWTTWHQTRAFLISVNNKNWCFWLVLQILNMERYLGRLSGWGVDPVVALHLRNAADYRLPTFGPHGTKLGHSWFHWIIEVIFFGWFDNSKKGEVSGQIEWMGGWSRGCTQPKECCRLPPTYFWATWHQTRAFLISVINKMCFFWLVWQFWKRWGVWADWVDQGLIPWFHSTLRMLQTTAYLLLGHMAPN